MPTPSPAVGGIQVGASYAPDGSVAEQMAASATYTQSLGDASVSLNVGYEVADDGDASNPSDLNAGASIVVGDIQVSGGMRDSEGGPGGASMHTDVGATVAMGALTLGAGWANQDSGTNMYALSAGYPLGEGVQLGMQLDFGDNGSTDWVQFMIGTGITF